MVRFECVLWFAFFRHRVLHTLNQLNGCAATLNGHNGKHCGLKHSTNRIQVDILFLSTPEQHSAHNPSVELNPKRLKQRLAALPVMNLTTTVKQLRASIEPFNEIQLSAVDRLKLTETYYQVFQDLSAAYDDFQLHRLPLSSVQRKALTEDIKWLHLELANSYKILIKEGYENQQNARKEQSLLLSIYRAIELISGGILFAYGAYESPPPMAFLELHQLYQLADSHQASTRPVKAVKRKSKIINIDHLYKRLLLLSASDPYKLSFGEVYELFSLIAPYAANCIIESGSNYSGENGVYVFLLTEDRPPIMCATDNLSFEIDTRIINTAPALAHIQQAIGESNANSRDVKYTLLRKFITQTLATRNPDKPRTSADRKVQMAIGLESVQHFLQCDPREFEAPAVEILGGIEVRSIDTDDEPLYELVQAQFSDESIGGCQLVTQKEAMGKKVSIGNILAIFETLDSPVELRTTIGVLRWIRGFEDGSCKLGIETVSGKPRIVQCQKQGDNKPTATKEALYFPGSGEAEQPASILQPKDDQPIPSLQTIDVEDSIFTVQRKEVLMDTPLFQLFSFKVLSKSMRTHKDEAAG